jgi:shikimate kinase
MKQKFDFNIFLIGFMGTGKSTVAAGLQELLDVQCIDMDAQIVKEQGMAITDIFAQFGEAHFRDIESEMILKLQQQTGLLVSCGGGVVVRPENGAYMKQNGVVVLLTATPQTIYDRVHTSTQRPILNGNMNVEYIAGLLEARQEKYQAAADITIATDGKSVEEICHEIIHELEERA